MDGGMGSVAVFLMLTGGFLSATGSAMVRRDGATTLAMAVAGVVCGHLARLPSVLLAWGATLVAVAMVAGLFAVVVCAMTGRRSGHRTGMVTTLVLLAATVSGSAGAAHDLAPPRVGTALSSRIASLLDR